MERFAVASPLGSLTVTLDGDNVTRLEFPHSLRNGKITQSAGTPASPAGVHAAATLDTYFACGDLGLLKLSPGGTAFQQRGWEALRAVPAGETATYGELAVVLGHPCSIIRLYLVLIPEGSYQYGAHILENSVQ